jgi:hypothetical protein
MSLPGCARNSFNSSSTRSDTIMTFG